MFVPQSEETSRQLNVRGEEPPDEEEDTTPQEEEASRNPFQYKCLFLFSEGLNSPVGGCRVCFGKRVVLSFLSLRVLMKPVHH